jgi:hypothetical protein
MSPYIPRGYVTTADAVDHIFRARNPDLAASTSARESEMRQLYEHYCSEFPGDHPIPARLTDAIRLRDAASKRRAIIMGAVNWRDTVGILRQAESQLEEPKQTLGAFGEEDLARLRELDRIGTEQHRLVTDAAIELRAALAEGDLVAVLNYEKMPAVSQFRWRKDDGLTIVEKACLSHQMEGTHTRFVESAVVLKKAELVRWLGLIPELDAIEPQQKELPSARRFDASGLRPIANVRGPDAKKRTEAAAAMRDALDQGMMTLDVLRRIKKKNLKHTFPGAEETTLFEVRRAVLRERESSVTATNSDKTPTKDK